MQLTEIKRRLKIVHKSVFCNIFGGDMELSYFANVYTSVVILFMCVIPPHGCIWLGEGAVWFTSQSTILHFNRLHIFFKTTIKNGCTYDIMFYVRTFFKKSFWRTHVLFFGGGGHWYSCFGFLVMSLGFKARMGLCLIHFFAEANVMYIP